MPPSQKELPPQSKSGNPYRFPIYHSACDLPFSTFGNATLDSPDEALFGEGAKRAEVTGRQRDHPDWSGGISPAAYLYWRIQQSIPAGQQIPPPLTSREVLMFFPPAPDPPAVPALPGVPVAHADINSVINPQLLLHRVATQAEGIAQASVYASSDESSSDESDSASESHDVKFFKPSTPRGRSAQVNYAIPAIPADYPRPAYSQPVSPTPSAAVAADIDDIQLSVASPHVTPRVTKSLPKGKRNKEAIAKKAVVEVQWQYPNNVKSSHNKPLGHGVLVNGKLEFTAHDLMSTRFIDTDKEIVSYWERRPNNAKMLPRIRNHLAMTSHQLGSAVNREMAECLPDVEQEAIAVLLKYNSVIWYNPGITVPDAILGSVRYVVNDMMMQ